MIGPGVGPSFYSGVPLPFPGATFGSDFTASQYQLNGAVYSSPISLPGWTFTRASTGYAETVAGTLTSFASGAPRITDKGLLVEEARTNVVLWNRDLTNAAWAHVNMTAAKDQTGPDGIANSASSLTAGAANSTSLQTIVLASSARFDTAYVKRITGSGVVEMTMDAGATWTPITIPATWGRVSIPTQTLANPVVGFRIVTSGDAIAVDFVQNENGAFATSPIATTTASATRAADSASLALALPATPTLVASAVLGDLTTTRTVASWNNGTTNNRIELYSTGTEAGGVFAASGGVSQINQTAASGPGRIKTALSFDGADYLGSVNGAAVAAATGKIAPAGVTALQIGVRLTVQQINNYVEWVVAYPTAFTQAQLDAASL